MNQTTMQKARESFLKNHYLNEASLRLLNDAEDLGSLLIEVEDCNGVERGVFIYNEKNAEFSLLEPDNFMRRRLPCNNTGKCYKEDVSFDTCLQRLSGEADHPFEQFLQLCIQGVYRLSEITIK